MMIRNTFITFQISIHINFIHNLSKCSNEYLVSIFLQFHCVLANLHYAAINYVMMLYTFNSMSGCQFFMIYPMVLTFDVALNLKISFKRVFGLTWNNNFFYW